MEWPENFEFSEDIFEEREMMDYSGMYDIIMELQYRIQAGLIRVAADDLLKYPHYEYNEMHYREVKALAATFELQEYLAGKVAEDDAKFSRLMQSYGEAKGQEYIELNERLQADPSAEVPADVDAKCLAAIERAFDN